MSEFKIEERVFYTALNISAGSLSFNFYGLVKFRNTQTNSATLYNNYIVCMSWEKDGSLVRLDKLDTWKIEEW